MAKRKRAQAAGAEGAHATSDVEQKVVAFAEQLGTLVGTVQSRAEGWLDRKALTKEITRIRDGAADLLAHVQGARVPPKTARTTRATAAQPSRGLVDAPGKRHRKPLPSERIDKRLGEPRGKQMGQKSAKRGPRGGR
jgi:hypothetical protein